MVMQVRECSADTIRVPFHVADDHSRTWVITRTTTGLRLKHDHRHKDGSEDKVTQYGGDSVTPLRAARQEFPADQFTKDLLIREGNTAGASNVWAVEVSPRPHLRLRTPPPEPLLSGGIRSDEDGRRAAATLGKPLVSARLSRTAAMKLSRLIRMSAFDPLRTLAVRLLRS